jgi:hypothetical protein
MTLHCRTVLGRQGPRALLTSISALIFLGADRGGVRENNTRIFESRASKFLKDTTTIALGQIIPLLAAYLFMVTDRDYLQAKTSLAEQSLAVTS